MYALQPTLTAANQAAQGQDNVAIQDTSTGMTTMLTWAAILAAGLWVMSRRKR